MQKYFTFSDGISNKYWYISTDDKVQTIVTGKIGKEGKSQSKTFATGELCEKDTIKQIAEKEKKGYELCSEIPDFLLSAATETASDATAEQPASVLADAKKGIQGQDIRKFLRMIKKDNLESVSEFLKTGLDPNEDSEWGQGYETALESGSAAMIKLLTPHIKGYGKNEKSSYIQEAIRNNYYSSLTIAEIIKAMMDGGYDIANDPHIPGVLPFAELDLAKKLIEVAHIDVCKIDDKLMIAVLEQKNKDLAVHLVEKGVPLTGIGLFSGLSVMHLVLEHFGDDLAFVKLFVEAGADVNTYSQGQYIREGLVRGGGETPLDYAMQHISDEVMKYLESKCDNLAISPDTAFRSARLDLSPLLLRFVEKEGANAQDSNGLSLLHYACTADHESTSIQNAMYLIKNGIDANLKDKMGRNALFYHNFESTGSPWGMGDELNEFLGIDNFFNAVLSKTSSMFWGELRQQYGVKEPETAEERFQYWLSGKSGDRDFLSLILRKAGADIECTDAKGMTPLMFHARYRPGEDFGQEITTSTEGREALSNVNLFGPVADRDRNDVCRRNVLISILRCQPDVNKRYPDDGATALHHLQNHKIFEKERILKLMYAMGADVDAQDYKGRTPLHYVALCDSKAQFMDLESEDAIEHLIAQGKANPDIQDVDGNTALHLALNNKNERYTVGALLKYGANPTLKNNEGLSAEDIMAQRDLLETYQSELLNFKKKHGKVKDIEIKWNPLEISNNCTIPIGNPELYASTGFPEYSFRHITTLEKNKILVSGSSSLGRAHCIDSVSGNLLWWRYHVHYPLWHAGKLYAGCENESFGEINAETGETVWSAAIGGEVRSPIIIHQDCALFANGQDIVAVDMKRKKKRWKVRPYGSLTKYVFLWNGLFVALVKQPGTINLQYINIQSGEVKNDIDLRTDSSIAECLHIHNKLWIRTYDNIILYVELDSERKQSIILEFDDDFDWKEHSVNCLFEYKSQPYAIVHLKPRKEGLTPTYRLCRVEGFYGHTVSDAPTGGYAKSYNDQIVVLGRNARMVATYNMLQQAWATWEFPYYQGDDDVLKPLHISDGCIFVGQEGGTQHKQQDLLYILK
ncbi:ankyrin repeat domain-containing protein [Dysgonomonas sp. 25]|uniref:ankyrin repeat domain-containing protein n=1 Tax=Dysgonomonas sp. 25 TaxID=2302933 RepID=UPI0013D6881F|nr:ankyrin repeat domain-containing protein [Dysgonomonas sp. 25]NDV68957.1 WGR domain-containing protein [Dysgonomonas sp. 25]